MAIAAGLGFGLDPLFRVGRGTKLCVTVFRLRNISNTLHLRREFYPLAFRKDFFTEL
jgi:hypothetical protein